MRQLFRLVFETSRFRLLCLIYNHIWVADTIIPGRPHFTCAVCRARKQTTMPF